MFTTILVPLDESPRARRALPYACFLARVGRGRLILLHAISDRELDRDPNAAVRSVFEEDDLAASLGEHGVAVTSEVRYGEPGATILGAARELGADLIVMATHSRGGLGRVIHRSVAERVLRHSPTPVLLATAAADRHWIPGHGFRILVPLDGSAFAEEALVPALDLSRPINAELRLLRVVQERWEIDALGFGHTSPVSQTDLDEAQQYLEHVATLLLRTGQKASVHVEAGHPDISIPRLVDDVAIDLVVMATHGRGSLTSLLLDRVATVAMGGRLHLGLGSVANAIAQHLSAPVLLVRPVEVARPGLVAPTDPVSSGQCRYPGSNDVAG